jgi:hydroxymethylpyrimidine pyrophosphatase-like HAD family hydrolase
VRPHAGAAARGEVQQARAVAPPAEALLAAPPPAAFVARLRSAGVSPLILGRVVVATLAPHEPAVRDAIRALAPELQIIRNNDAVMVLPRGVDKASGLATALAELGIAPGSTVAVGDAENDLAMLAACGSGVAVANALGSVKARAAWVTKAERGAGVEEVIARLLESQA